MRVPALLAEKDSEALSRPWFSDSKEKKSKHSVQEVRFEVRVRNSQRAGRVSVEEEINTTESWG